MKELSIILVNYNSEDYLHRCINSFSENNINLDYEILIIDNHSPGREKLYALTFKNPQIKIIYNDKNIGFGGGCNIGADDAEGEYLLFLNPDVKFIDDSITKMLSILKTDENIGALTPVFYDADGNMILTYGKFPSLEWEFAEAAGLDGTKRITERLNKILAENIGKTEIFFVESFTGACILTTKEKFIKCGKFDEDMFLYYEDTDLLKKISDSGYKNAVFTSGKAIHTANTSTKSVDGEYFYYYHLNRSRLIYYYRHFSFLKLNFFRLMQIIGIIFRLLSLPFRKKYMPEFKKRIIFYLKLINIYTHSYERKKI